MKVFEVEKDDLLYELSPGLFNADSLYTLSMFKIDPLEIGKIRRSLKLTQLEFAQLFGVHHMTASKWERGELKPTGYQLALMTDFTQALKNDPNVTNLLSAMLVGSSITNALFMLLHRARQSKPIKK